ncbi:MAG TPA: hypothetical protein VGO16_13485 [Pseudonocardiaceae bacterium]|jgi:L-seryl-tRNA(Ser) seleniumtransferase|nr:hypothetical protein [Pseudonocardiaceae bacterium]
MDLRRQVPRTDPVLADPAVAAAADKLGRPQVKWAVTAAQQRVREGALPPAGVVADVLATLPDTATTLRPVLNATGVLLHTLCRAPLSAAAIGTLSAVAGTTDVELTWEPAGRAGVLAALARHRAGSRRRPGHGQRLGGPLIEHLAHRRITRRLPNATHELRL